MVVSSSLPRGVPICYVIYGIDVGERGNKREYLGGKARMLVKKNLFCAKTSKELVKYNDNTH